MKLILSFIVFFSALGIAQGQFKEPENVSIDELMLDIQYTKEDPDELVMIWWIPLEFWEVSNAQDPTTSPEDFKALKAILEGYEIVAVVKGTIGYFGGINYEPKEDILKQIKVEYKGEELQQVPQKKITGDLGNFFAMMQPMMVNMFGPMGENMHFVFLENNITSKVLPIDSRKENDVTFTLGDFTKKVDLPLNSLLLEKKCPRDKQLHSGKWSYCPFHGTKLVSQ
ncbi:hypothetical protein [Marinirhabdus gelatinilytica]|uniref:Uncharacterized protein n=1 Tax=Marinirhabdus gelatinilytica TaxID=1703343 RepID=A0A370QKG1_9FLAO|nr:hypothetical protein [Marinirhabdus gelatinilytica]RDK88857.1 hypothetical protein C8D94_101734 [Marinirhabdus gelatinilytica]